MHPLRERVKRELLKAQWFRSKCPLCQKPASQLHEVISPNMGNKYDPNYVELAEIVYTRANCVILCGACNIAIGGGASKRDELIRYNMGLYGPDEVLSTLGAIAKLSSRDRIPAQIEFKGKVYHVYE